jgi:prolipoprotein diacylglyceryltransferase
LDPLGGLVIGALAATIYGQRVKLPLLQTLDALTPTLATLGISLGLAHLAAGTAFGAVSDILWSINLWGANRHPTQIYETIFAAIILWFTWPGRKQAFFYLPGARFFTFLALTAGARLLLEGFRGDSAVLENGIRTAQIFAWVILGASLVILRQLTLNPSMAADGKETSRPPKKSGKKR